MMFLEIYHHVGLHSNPYSAHLIQQLQVVLLITGMSCAKLGWTSRNVVVVRP